MKFVVLLAETEPEAWEAATAEEREAVYAAHLAFERAVAERGSIVAGEALEMPSTARTLSPATASGRVVTDGPYAETAEKLGGFMVIDVADLDEAVELCHLLPAAYTIEVRPVMDLEDYGAE